MANEEHLARLKQGAGLWNHWRQDHPEIHPGGLQAEGNTPPA